MFLRAHVLLLMFQWHVNMSHKDLTSFLQRLSSSIWLVFNHWSL